MKKLLFALVLLAVSSLKMGHAAAQTLPYVNLTI